MTRLPRALCASSWLLWILATSPAVFGQSILLTEYAGKHYPVVAAKGMRPFVEVEGKRVLAVGTKFAMREIPEFLPMFVSVRRMHVETSSINLVDTGSQVNNEFHFRASFESPYSLKDVFLVLDLTMEDKSRSLFLYEIGILRANNPHAVNVTAPIGYPLGRGNFKIHLYSGGLEVLHSEQPFQLREQMLDRLIARRIKERPDGQPTVFFGPSPEYPAKLQKSKIAGQVKMQVRIRPTGAVLDAKVLSATEPAMGESALTAIRQWRFLPRIEKGVPVEAMAVVPIEFTPGVEPPVDP